MQCGQVSVVVIVIAMIRAFYPEPLPQFGLRGQPMTYARGLIIKHGIGLTYISPLGSSNRVSFAGVKRLFFESAPSAATPG